MLSISRHRDRRTAGPCNCCRNTEAEERSGKLFDLFIPSSLKRHDPIDGMIAGIGAVFLADPLFLLRLF